MINDSEIDALINLDEDFWVEVDSFVSNISGKS